MRVILTDDVFELGRRGQVVSVSSGYGRNYLIPKRLAVLATPGNLKVVEEQRIAMAKKEAKHVEEAQILAQELGQVHVLISRKVGEKGVLFGSVTSKDVSDVLEANGINLDRRRIVLSQPIKTIGNFQVAARPHTDVEATILVSVLPEGDQETAKTMPRGEESDKVVAEIEAKIEELSPAASTAAAAVADQEAPEE
ncbi:MAG: 50S ribosomal protein L9 [Acidobacteriota bacterium]|nr:MAG: 50S ribosomal protein L9 [Acidobacteriota bacterium]